MRVTWGFSIKIETTMVNHRCFSHIASFISAMQHDTAPPMSGGSAGGPGPPGGEDLRGADPPQAQAQDPGPSQDVVVVEVIDVEAEETPAAAPAHKRVRVGLNGSDMRSYFAAATGRTVSSARSELSSELSSEVFEDSDDEDEGTEAEDDLPLAQLRTVLAVV